MRAGWEPPFFVGQNLNTQRRWAGIPMRPGSQRYRRFGVPREVEGFG
jgi:hypothetical protein